MVVFIHRRFFQANNDVGNIAVAKTGGLPNPIAVRAEALIPDNKYMSIFTLGFAFTTIVIVLVKNAAFCPRRKTDEGRPQAPLGVRSRTTGGTFYVHAAFLSGG